MPCTTIMTPPVSNRSVVEVVPLDDAGDDPEALRRNYTAAPLWCARVRKRLSRSRNASRMAAVAYGPNGEGDPGSLKGRRRG